MKLAAGIAILLSFVSTCYCADTHDACSFSFQTADMRTCLEDGKSNAGYAILSKGRFLYYKRWLTEDSNALECVLVDTNKVPDKHKDWFNGDCVFERMLYLSKLALSERDIKAVERSLKEKTYQKETQKNGDLVFHIPGTTYSEFYFAIRRPGDYIEDAIVKLRYVMTL
ncbi:hypothetical protein LPW11_07170 [Geomonas sp. RF6]|uniref:hypothetical protein n=1 Tax=Geomonas sp. RF6 TaxID=2897342 RepID=UPI001E3CE1C4|nr:hypothetical protein [Geomonas sp. RF6]UFS71964.1 hypothetical protein LPW11_07170 [Geomonas sp. RF6]